MKLPHPKTLNHFLSCLLLAGLLTAGCATQQATSNSEADTNDNTTTSETVSAYEQNRPVPNSIAGEVPPHYYTAIDNGTRTSSGVPGQNYWQQYASYDMEVELVPQEKRVVGSSTITYQNNSPSTLNQLFLELSQNAHKEGVVRNESAEITGRINIHYIVVEGDTMDVIERRNQAGYIVDGTLLALVPPRGVRSGESVTIEIGWDFTVPQEGAGGRMGYSEENLFFIAYWYPQMRVYDDVIGWMNDYFQINAEFYHGFADYNVDITVPEQWIVTSTGSLNNANEVLQPVIFQRLERGHNSDSVVHVVREEDFGNVTQSGNNGKVTWNYSATKVRDFAFSVTKESLWDATRSPVGDLDGDGQTDYTSIDALYRTSAPLWKDAASHSRHSIDFLSDYTGLPYPWPHMTAVEGGGIIGGGMEFPMMTLIGSYNGRATQSLYAVIAHELAHMWVPMIVSNNERRYAWMDEGTTTFNENQAKKVRYPNAGNYDISEFQSYIQIAGSGFEGEIMRWSDYHYNSFAYGIASYAKPGSMLATLRGLLGEETFNTALRGFIDAWKYKHPYPWDMFNAFEDASGRDLDWFWRSWYYETWVLDQAVEQVAPIEGGTRIVIEDRGEVPMPATVEITLRDGTKLQRKIDVQTWLEGATTAVLTVEAEQDVTKVVIDPDFLFPDINRANNKWEK